MQIDPTVETQVRELLGHALRVELDDFQRVLTEAAGKGKLDDALTLTTKIAGVVVMHLCDGKPPTDDDLKEIAQTTVDIDDDYSLTEDEVGGYLGRVVFGGEQLSAVFSADDAARLPFAITANLLGSAAKVEDGQQWTDLLDQVEAALEAAPDPS